MGFKPVNLCFSYRTILKLNCRESLAFEPVTRSEQPDEPRQNVDSGSRGDRFHAPNLTHDLAMDFELHDGRLSYWRQAA